MESLTDEDPRSVGGYELRARLGQGGFGKVYLGLSPAGRAVAVKVLRPELGEDREFLHRFRLEAAAAQRVNGLYTAPIVAAGLNDRRPWVATAFVSGPSLERAVAVNGPLPELAVWRLLAGLVEALQAIHACGLVHRDLKPDNVLLAADGPRVIDFGISKSLDGTGVTATGMIVGTPSFMAPEQADGEAVGPESDVFSLGCVLAYAATGALPFGAGSHASVLYRVVFKDPLLDGVPPRLRPVIERCLAKAPQARPSLAELAKIGRDGPAGVSAQSTLAFWPAPVGQLIREFEGQLDNVEDTTEPFTSGLSSTVEDPSAYPLDFVTPPSPTPATIHRRKAAGDQQRQASGQHQRQADGDHQPQAGGQHQRGQAGGQHQRGQDGARSRWRGRRWLPVVLAASVVLAAAAVAAALNLGDGTSVPQVKGDPQAQAVERIHAAGLKPEMVRRIDSRVGSGLVISTRPASGSSVRKGLAVTVYLSAGPGVPVVHGLTWSRAGAAIRAAGFAPVEHREASSTVRAGDVIGTRPASGAIAPPNGHVTVDVSTGSAPRALPDVRGLSAASARARLLHLGFRNVELVTDPESVAARGEVDQMSPAPGRYQPGKRVTLYISAGGVAVPRVIGDTASEATAHLEQDGFTVEVDHVAAPERSAAPGAVYSENPGGGTTERKGALIRIFVEPETVIAPVPTISAPGIFLGF